MLASDQVLKFPLTEIVRPCLSTFFCGGHWGQCLELLSHLCQYGNKVLLVTGPTGIGKTSMKYALEKRQFENLHLIDDAHNLSLDQVSALLDVQDQQVVLFGLPELITRVNNSSLQDDFASRVRVIEVEILTFSEMKRFLQHQWHSMGNEDKIYCKKADLKRIYSLSKGIPGKVKQLFSDSLRGSDVLKTKSDMKGLSPFIVGFTVACGVVLCFMALLWPTSRDQIIISKQPLPENTLITQIQIEEQSPPEHTLLTQVQIEEQPVTDEYFDVSIHEEQLAKLESKLLALQHATKHQKNVAPQVADNKPLAVKPETQTVVDVVLNGTAGEKKILQSNKKNYALQLLAAGNEENVKNFIKKHNLSDKAYYYSGTRQGKPWFTVVYGNYKDRDAALSDAKKLPSAIRKLGPWARQYVHIQSSIEQHLIND